MSFNQIIRSLLRVLDVQLTRLFTIPESFNMAWYAFGMNGIPREFDVDMYKVNARFALKRWI